MRQAWTEGSPRSAGSTTRSTAPASSAAAAAAGRHPAVDRGRRREGHAQDRREVRAVHQLRRHPRRLHPQVRAAARALPRRRHRLRRDRPLRQLQRGDRPGRGRGAGADAGREGAPRALRRRGEGGGVARRGARDARVRHTGADRREPPRAGEGGHELRHLQLRRGRLRPQRHRAVRAGGHPRARWGEIGGIPDGRGVGCGSMASCASPSSEPGPPASTPRLRSPAAGTPSWWSTATPGPRRTGSGAGPG